jgi:spermidine synthase
MSKLPRLQAYGYNLVGSLLGISAFTSLSFFWAPPAVWLLFPTLALLWFSRHHRGAFWLSAVLALLAIIAIQRPLPETTEIHSPYQLISFNRKNLSLKVNNAWFQQIYSQQKDRHLYDGPDGTQGEQYTFPYQFVHNPKRVLIVGAGTGNDTSAALLNNASHVDAVEIDPAILGLGKQFHPDEPYSAPNVNAILDDARSFIRRSNQNYDLIVYGGLDAHTSASALSSVRLDSFVHTIEGYREARGLLSDDGLIVVIFALTSREQGKKLFVMLKEAFDGKEPKVFRHAGNSWLVTLVSGNSDKHLSVRVEDSFVEITDQFNNGNLGVDPSTDDWPFLYINKRTYPIGYAILLSMLFVVAIVIANQTVDKGARLISAPSFFLGVGFLLVEAKNITELGLVLGNRWQVISVVIASILLMAFLANLLAIRLKTHDLGLIYILLLSSLALGTIYLPAIAASGNLKNSLPLATVVLAAPLFFSGLAFSLELKRANSIIVVMSSNLLGAMLGGILEYNSLYFGFRGLYVIAILVYVMAFIFSVRRWRPIPL